MVKCLPRQKLINNLGDRLSGPKEVIILTFRKLVLAILFNFDSSNLKLTTPTFNCKETLVLRATAFLGIVTVTPG